MRHTATTILAAAILLPGTALAYVLVGNPTAFTANHTGLVSAVGTIDSVEAHHCTGGGSTVHIVDDEVDLANGFELDVYGGDICAITVVWASDLVLTGSGWTLTYSRDETSMTLDTSTGEASAALIPYTVTSGTFSGAPVSLDFQPL